MYNNQIWFILAREFLLAQTLLLPRFCMFIPGSGIYSGSDCRSGTVRDVPACGSPPGVETCCGGPVTATGLKLRLNTPEPTQQWRPQWPTSTTRL
ncbi:hypothetical protein PR001_g16945 [Phytophthora rubi]|uniref:Secreted protein n=1 Tax=Phytophthora rubi TaxID=129364 RepID=A0A6A3KQN7_9STRA|nr:hypothetical protein PR001_g16945 [Phytophthora rubi]